MEIFPTITVAFRQHSLTPCEVYSRPGHIVAGVSSPFRINGINNRICSLPMPDDSLLWLSAGNRIREILRPLGPRLIAFTARAGGRLRQSVIRDVDQCGPCNQAVRVRWKCRQATDLTLDKQMLQDVLKKAPKPLRRQQLCVVAIRWCS